MKKITIQTTFKKLLADVYTPVGIYLRLRDRFRDTILLESTDFHAGENSYSFIGINAVAGIEISDATRIEYKLPGQNAEKIKITSPQDVPGHLMDFMQRFEMTETAARPVNMAQGLFGYSSYDAVQFFDTISIRPDRSTGGTGGSIPLMRYRLYQYVIIVDHFKDELFICENLISGLESEGPVIESLIKSRDVPAFPFQCRGAELSNMTDADYREMVKKGIAGCQRGDVFQIVLSRRFEQAFTGDEFNVYRALRSINPSPYLFYFDYGSFKLFGSSPEAQLQIKNQRAFIYPIAGTFRRSGNDLEDATIAAKLSADEKENAEHVMLVDLARNDMSRNAHEVKVEVFKEIQYYSHVIHLVSKISGKLNSNTLVTQLFADSFPAGTLSGAPKVMAMNLIHRYENVSRGFYGGAIGLLSFDGSLNKAIMIRTFLSKDNQLIYQAGAGIVSKSDNQKELQEVNNKLEALRKAMSMAEGI